MQDDSFKAFFRSTDPGIEFEDPEPEQEKIVTVKPLKGDELDSLVGEIGIERKDGEEDIDLRERAALKALDNDAVKALEMMLAKRGQIGIQMKNSSLNPSIRRKRSKKRSLSMITFTGKMSPKKIRNLPLSIM